MSITLKNHARPYPTESKGLRAGVYVPDLAAFMSLCDANYVKFLKLLPAFDNHDQSASYLRCFGLSRNQHELGIISIEILERAKYTTTLLLKQSSEIEAVPSTTMQVRLYHDASMAEVLSYQGVAKLKANYAYPNKHMFQKDEKVLCNEFLADWLSYCLKFGYSLVDPCVSAQDFSGEKSLGCLTNMGAQQKNNHKKRNKLKNIKEDEHK